MSTNVYRCWLSVAGLAVCGVFGCASLQLPWDQHRFVKASAQNPVVQVVCLWEQAEGRDPDGVPCRGFAGQILFLANRHATPVEIEGAVRIYLFDNVGSVEEQSKPLRQYDFDNEAWKLHLTKSAVGASYSVFVPYVRRGQHNAQCSLRVRLTPKAGPVIFSEMTSLPLRGPTTAEGTTIVSEPNAPEEKIQANVNAALSQAVQKSSTIPLRTTDSGRLTLANPGPAANAPQAPSPTDDRLDRMERLLAAALADRNAAIPVENSPTDGVQQAGYETPASEYDADPAPPHRFKLNQKSE